MVLRLHLEKVLKGGKNGVVLSLGDSSHLHVCTKTHGKLVGIGTCPMENEILGSLKSLLVHSWPNAVRFLQWENLFQWKCLSPQVKCLLQISCSDQRKSIHISTLQPLIICWKGQNLLPRKVTNGNLKDAVNIQDKRGEDVATFIMVTVCCY